VRTTCGAASLRLNRNTTSSVLTMPAPATSNLSFSTILTWLFYLVPIYLFLIAPGLRILFPSSSSSTTDTTGRKDGVNLLESFGFGDNFDDYDDLVPGLNTTDDSFISPEDPELLAQLHCRDDDYRVHLFSRSPLIIYIEDFFTDAEADHLVAVRCVPTLPR
jgi:prolyl 4-hydroxylase